LRLWPRAASAALWPCFKTRRRPQSVQSEAPALIFWSGSSADAINDISAWGVKNLDEYYNAAYYQRIASRAAPHNVYSSIAELNKLESSKGYTTSHYQGFARAKTAPLKVPTASTISLTLSGPDYNPSYSYNQATNSYDRSESGQPMIDAGTNKVVSPTVVIAMVVPYSLGALDSTNAYYSVYQVVGSGPVFIFQNGGVTTGQWAKTSDPSQITFKDASGNTIPLEPGQTWLTAVATSSDVAYH
jgi:hypothetical protein